jgi:opacity protein-like surface antigen
MRFLVATLLILAGAPASFAESAQTHKARQPKQHNALPLPEPRASDEKAARWNGVYGGFSGGGLPSQDKGDSARFGGAPK